MAIKGAVLGDILGSQYEFNRPKNLDWQNIPRIIDDKAKFTDDSVMMLAIKKALVIKEAEDVESRVQEAQKILDDDIFEKNTLQEKYLKLADEAVANDPDKPVAQKIRNALGQETGYVKVSETDWKKMLRIFRVTRTEDKAVEEMSKDMAVRKSLSDIVDKCKEFLQQHNLIEAFKEIIKPKEQKEDRVSVREKIAANKKILAGQELAPKEQDQNLHKKQQIAI